MNPVEPGFVPAAPGFVPAAPGLSLPPVRYFYRGGPLDGQFATSPDEFRSAAGDVRSIRSGERWLSLIRSGETVTRGSGQKLGLYALRKSDGTYRWHGVW